MLKVLVTDTCLFFLGQDPQVIARWPMCTFDGLLDGDLSGTLAELVGGRTAKL